MPESVETAVDSNLTPLELQAVPMFHQLRQIENRHPFHRFRRARASIEGSDQPHRLTSPATHAAHRAMPRQDQ